MTNKAARIRTAATSSRIDSHDDAPEISRDVPSDTDPAEQSYTTFIAGFSEAKGCRVKVHRQTPRGRQYCFYGTPEEIDSEETIRLFHAKQPYAHEDGLYYLSVEVNGELRSCFPVSIAPQVGVPEQQGLQAASGGMADVLREIKAQNERLERMLLQKPEPTPMVEVIEGLSRLDQLRGGTQQQLPMEVMMKAIEMGQKLSSAGVPTEDWSSLLREVIKDNAPAIGMLLTQMFKGQPQPQQAIAAAQQHGPGSVPPGPVERKETPTMTPEQQEESVLQESLKLAIQFLKKKAARNSDPGLYVDMIVDNREDPLYARLISDITTKDFSAFAEIDKEIERPEYFGFFRFIYDGIRSVFDQAHSMATAGHGKAGNKGNPANDGGSGKKSSK